MLSISQASTIVVNRSFPRKIRNRVSYPPLQCRKSPLRDRSSSLDLDRRLALDLGGRHLSMDLTSLYSATGSSSTNGRNGALEVEQKDLNIDPLRKPRYQSGVLRTNCIDCLDRTNVAQYAYGLEALGRQLQACGLIDCPKIDPDCEVAAALMDMYHNMGDCLALQYGGSEAHNYVFPERQGKWKATTHSQEFFKSIRRYYSNTITDGEKQDAMNLFLGHFQPQEGKPDLWELETDYYLHVSGQGEESLLEQRTTRIPSRKPSFSSQKSRNRTLFSVSPYDEDFRRLKMTSFDKLQATRGSVKSVRMYGDSGFKRRAVAGVASDAAEVQLKSPNWLYGQRKPEDSGPANVDSPISVKPLATKKEKNEQEFENLDWLTTLCPYSEEELFTRYVLMGLNEDDSWYGTRLLPGTVNSSEANRHYMECCQGPPRDFEDVSSSRGAVSFQSVCELIHFDEDMVKLAMEAALSQFKSIESSDFHLAGDAPALNSTSDFDKRFLVDHKLCQVLS